MFASFGKAIKSFLELHGVEMQTACGSLQDRGSAVRLAEGSPGGALICSPCSPRIQSSRRAAAVDGSGRSRSKHPGCAEEHGGL